MSITQLLALLLGITNGASSVDLALKTACDDIDPSWFNDDVCYFYKALGATAQPANIAKQYCMSGIPSSPNVGIRVSGDVTQIEVFLDLDTKKEKDCFGRPTSESEAKKCVVCQASSKSVVTTTAVSTTVGNVDKVLEAECWKIEPSWFIDNKCYYYMYFEGIEYPDNIASQFCVSKMPARTNVGTQNSKDEAEINVGLDMDTKREKDCFGRPTSSSETKKCVVCEASDQEPITTTIPSSTTTTATTTTPTTTTTTKPPPPRFIPSRQNMMQLWTFYNFGTVSHAPANPGGWFQNYLATKGYHMSSGINYEGWVIPSTRLAEAKAGCSDPGALYILKIRWENGNAWVARLGVADGNDVGVVAQRQGSCGANRAIWTWSCRVSPEWHYTNDIATMEANTWYRGRRWSATPEFWTWNL